MSIRFGIADDQAWIRAGLTMNLEAQRELLAQGFRSRKAATSMLDGEATANSNSGPKFRRP